MSELMRFRTTRTPQRRIPARASLISLVRTGPATAPLLVRGKVAQGEQAPWLAQLLAARSPDTLANDFVEGASFVEPSTALAEPADIVQELDFWLAAANNAVSPVELTKKIQVDSVDLVNAGGWVSERQRVANSLIASLFADVSIDTRVYLTRLILIFGLVELLAETPGAVKTKQDVADALRWRMVVLPEELLRYSGPLRSAVVRRPGFSDLYVVRNEWTAYEAGEIAEIENVLAAEFKERTHVRTNEIEETTVMDRETSELQERDLQSTDRFETHVEATKDTSLAVHVEGQVDVSGQYGPAHVDAHLGASFDYSIKESEKRATDQARETVARAVTQVEERVRETRATRTLTRIQETNRHIIDNTPAGSDNIAGVYRWVDKIQRFQIFRYPHRLLLEFEIPEPASFVRWRLERGKYRGMATPEPEPLIALLANGDPVASVDGKGKPLTPADIFESNYQHYIARYQALGVEPPPPQRVTVSEILKLATTEETMVDKSKFDFVDDTTATAGLQVPSGYRATRWTAALLGASVIAADPEMPRPTDEIPHVGDVMVVVGTTSALLSAYPPILTTVDRSGGVFDGPEAVEPRPTGPLTGRIPVSARGTFVKAFELSVVLDCELLAEKLQAWQFKTFEAVANAYWSLKRQHEEERAAMDVQQGVTIDGASPTENQRVVKEELKRQVIELLTGQQFRGHPAVSIDPTGDEMPRVLLDDAVADAPEVQFLEQAFEWENMTFVLYPYFWAADTRWAELSDISGADPEYARFLRAGSARVVLAARPTFESQVVLYSALGTLWGGGPVPVPGTVHYLSVAEEIKAQQRAPDDGIPGESWDVRLPTTLVWLAPQGTNLPITNPASTLDAPPGQPMPPV